MSIDKLDAANSISALINTYNSLLTEKEKIAFNHVIETFKIQESQGLNLESVDEYLKEIETMLNKIPENRRNRLLQLQLQIVSVSIFFAILALAMTLGVAGVTIGSLFIIMKPSLCNIGDGGLGLIGVFGALSGLTCLPLGGGYTILALHKHLQNIISEAKDMKTQVDRAKKMSSAYYSLFKPATDILGDADELELNENSGLVHELV